MKTADTFSVREKSGALEELVGLSGKGENPYISEWKSNGGMVFGFACDYVPEEVLYAEPVSILPVRMGAAGCGSTSEADVRLHKNICGFSRCLLQQGLTLSAFTVLFRGSTSSAAGISIAVVSLLLVGWTYLYIGRIIFSPSMFRGTVVPYQHALQHFPSAVRSVLLPSGFWTPANFVRPYGSCFVAYNEGCRWFAVVPIARTLLISIVAAIDVQSIDPTKCGVQYVCLALISVMTATVTVVARPYCTAILTPLSAIANIAVGIVAASAVWAALEPLTPSLMIVAVSISVVSATIGVATKVCETKWWKKNEQQALANANNNNNSAGPTPPSSAAPSSMLSCASSSDGIEMAARPLLGVPTRQ